MKCSLALIALPAVALACRSGHEEKAEKKPVVSVRLATAELADVERLVRAPAVVHPRQQAGIASRLTAVIKELPVRKGDRVAAGAVVARLDARDLEAQRSDAAAALHLAEVTAERRAKLFEEGAIPNRDLLVSQTERAQAKARLDLVETQLEFSELVSPFSGTLTEQFMYPGDMARPDSPVFTVMDNSIAIARAQVPETEAGPIRQGQACAFAPTDHPGETFRGRLSVVTRAVDPARRTVETWCEIGNGAGKLLPGAFGELSVVTGIERASVVVPLDAVQLEEGTRKGSVVVVDARNLAHRREVVTGEQFDGHAQVTSGLRAGDRVVVTGGYELTDGTSVRVEANGEPDSGDHAKAEAGAGEKDEK